MAFNATGTIKHILPLVTGNGRNGEWKKQDVVIEIPGDYPKDICLSVWGDTINRLKNLSEGEMVDVSFDIESREHNGRWFTNAKCFFIKAVGEKQQKTINVDGQELPYKTVANAEVLEEEEDASSLPF